MADAISICAASPPKAWNCTDGLTIYSDGRFISRRISQRISIAPDDTYNRINVSIDGFIEKHGIDARRRWCV